MKADLSLRIRNWLRQSWQIASLSLIAAVVIFYTVRENISYTETIALPVVVEREPGLAVMSVRPPTVRVTFRGSISDVRQLVHRDMQVSVRTPRNGTSGGTTPVELKAGNVRGGRGGRVIAIEPQVVHVNFDHQGEMEFPVQPPAISGRPLRGRTELSYMPHAARLRGARMQLEALHANGLALQTEPVDVDGRVQGFSTRVAILPPPDAWMPEIVPPEVLVKVEILPDNAVRLLENVPVLLAVAGHPGERIVPDPAIVTVRLLGREENLRELDPEAVRAYAACPADFDTRSTNTVPLNVYLPSGAVVEGVEAVPAAVRLRRLTP